MSEQTWYLYQQGQQLGPFTKEQMVQMITTKMIANDAYLFKVGWEGWRPLEDTLEEFGMNNTPGSDNRRQAAPRATTAGRIVVHNNGQLTFGNGVNISTTGVFVETKERHFQVGEKLKLSVRCDGLAKAFNAQATVIRYNTDPRYPIGYGLQFDDIEETSRNAIRMLVDQYNSNKMRKSSHG